MSKWNVKVQGNAQFNEGDGVQNNADAPTITVKQFFDKLAESLPDDTSVDTQLAHQALDNIESMAAAYPDGTPPESESTIVATMRPYLDKLMPFAPKIANVLLAFGDGYFSTLASKNAVVAGVVEAFKAARQ